MLLLSQVSLSILKVPQCSKHVLQGPHSLPYCHRSHSTQHRHNFRRAISGTRTLNWLQWFGSYFLRICPSSSGLLDEVSMTLGLHNTGEPGPNNATMPTAAPLSGWTIANKLSLGRNNTGTGSRYGPTSCPGFKFRDCSKLFRCCFCWVAQMAKSRSGCLDMTLLWLKRRLCVGTVCVLVERRRTKGVGACNTVCLSHKHAL